MDESRLFSFLLGVVIGSTVGWKVGQMAAWAVQDLYRLWKERREFSRRG